MSAIFAERTHRLLACALRQRRTDDELLLTLLTFFLCYLLSPR